MSTYSPSNADLALIRSKRIAVIGYGNQGEAHALNLRDSGVADIVIGARELSASADKARAAGFAVMSNAVAAREADIVVLAAPDAKLPEIYASDLAPTMKQGATLLFIHGFALHFGFIRPRDDLDVVLVAPAGPGHALRADDDVRHAGVAQVQRMRLALIAVADDGDTLAPNEREIGIGGRVSAHLLLRCIGPAKPASWQSCFLASRGEITWRKHRAFWRPSMKTLDISSLALAAIALLTLPVPAAAGRHKFINFDVPGAGASFPSDINDNNDVTGDYRDLSGVYH